MSTDRKSNGRKIRLLPALLASLFLSLPTLHAQINIPTPGQRSLPLYHPVTGSSNEVTADPTPNLPTSKPCRVWLYNKQVFADFSNKPFTYTPSAECRGPWSKVVLVGDFYVQKGVQYDRTAQIFLNNVNIYFGTTPEPLSNTNNPWHFERDLTDYSSLFYSPQSGQTILGNLIEPGLNSAIVGSVSVLFYPVDQKNIPAVVANAVLPLPNNANGAYGISTSNPQLSATFTLPTNTIGAYLDVIAESQSQEEQWFTCVPNDIASELFDCGDTGYREVEVTVDGTPAGMAPVSPWIYTGGLDPYLWVPIPGVQTTNFVPYRVNLSPFAAQMNDGKPHTIGLTVFNAYNYFNVTGALLLYTDPSLSKVTGQLTANTMRAPKPQVTRNYTTNDPSNGLFVGSVTTNATRKQRLSGYVNTSLGQINTDVEQTVDFHNTENINSSPTHYIQDTFQNSSVQTNVKYSGGILFGEEDTKWAFPITVSQKEVINPDNSLAITTSVDQLFANDITDKLEGFTVFQSRLTNEVKPVDTFKLVPVSGGYSVAGNSGQSSWQKYFYKDTFGNCYSRTINAANNAVTGYTDGAGCQ
jgi:hypothetical protein